MEDEYLALGVGKLEIEWLRNAIGRQDHSVLFSANDKIDIPYYFDDKDGTIISKPAPGYSKSMEAVRERLDLLGYSFAKLPTKLEDYFLTFPYETKALKQLSAKKIIDMLAAIDVDQIDWVEHEGDADLGELFTRRILTLPQFDPLKQYLDKFKGVEPYVFEQIDPYILLAAIAHNPKNAHLPVQWRRVEPLGDGLEINQKFLIVTEGSTDGLVIKKAIEILKPNVADFFDFIDMKDNYPFGSAGELSKFFKGLCKVGTSRPIIFLFDNDSEGHGNLQKLQGVAHPVNFKKFAMPDMPEFSSFETLGPTGTAIQDVNKRAVAIEMYLDHAYKIQDKPFVRWSSFNSMAKEYQGALENKEKYFDKFMDLRAGDHANYNFTRLKKLLDFLISKIVD
ncbi:HEPN/Toprim-associated domain-containing protein [Mucilaginibacter sp. AK015]|uniref:HEPN/Toprim-associated domain-containing protein n=1 Tax=Mucilaginibacter sp. AK015 TaxID=2723072 RepID=UPI00160B0501|nr:HEPN/Toprim-associated domain-containing protein [Mucilaginibacter sp. AK015]MBB5396687.1 hypothetical protein [Mucilaginibacter sp. AK015]